MTTVAEWLTNIDKTFIHDEKLKPILDKTIVREYDGTTHAFPQANRVYRNVFNWILLEDGTSVGWNESPRSGWSFPRSSKNITEKYLAYFKDKGI